MGMAYLSLGSNVEPERHLRAAVAALRARFGEVLLSPVYRTRSVGFDGTDFLNAAAVIDSDLDPPRSTTGCMRWKMRMAGTAAGRASPTARSTSTSCFMTIWYCRGRATCGCPAMS